MPLRENASGTTTLNQDRTHNAANELGTIDVWQNPAHDAAGNMTAIPRPKSPASGYTAKYDAWNRLVSLHDGTSHVQVNEYDGIHRRTVRDETGGAGAVRHFYYNEDWQCVEERDASYTFVKRHHWHPYYIDALAATIDSSGTRTSFVHDANMNVTAAINTSQQVIERYHYTPYGEVTYLNPDFSVKGTQASAVGNEFLYTGRRLDLETGLYQFRHRYYHAQLGRFVNRDPQGYLDGYNLHAAYFAMHGVVDPYGTSIKDTIIDYVRSLSRPQTHEFSLPAPGGVGAFCDVFATLTLFDDDEDCCIPFDISIGVTCKPEIVFNRLVRLIPSQRVRGWALQNFGKLAGSQGLNKLASVEGFGMASSRWCPDSGLHLDRLSLNASGSFGNGRRAKGEDKGTFGLGFAIEVGGGYDFKQDSWYGEFTAVGSVSARLFWGRYTFNRDFEMTCDLSSGGCSYAY